MLENLKVTSAIVAPFLCYMLLGIFLRHIGLLEDDTAKKLNNLLFRVLMPVNIFKSMYSADLSGIFSNISAPYALFGTLLVLFLLMQLAKKLSKDPAVQGAMVHAGFRGNVMLFALPIAQGIFGTDDIPEVLIILTVVMLVNNFSGVPLMESYRRKVRLYRGEAAGEEKFSMLSLLKSLFTTPLLDAVVLGFIWAVFRLPFGGVPLTVVKSLAGCVTPIAFMVMGARIDFSKLKENSGLALLTVAIKLVISPALFLVYPLLAGWDEKLVVAILVAFASPSAIVCYAMTEGYECDGDLSAKIITLGSVFSLFTLFLWIFCFKQFGVIS